MKTITILTETYKKLRDDQRKLEALRERMKPMAVALGQYRVAEKGFERISNMNPFQFWMIKRKWKKAMKKKKTATKGLRDLKVVDMEKKK